jgi:chromosome segregation ATPase
MPTTSATATSLEELEARVAEITERKDTLRAQLKDAHEQVQRTNAELGELAEERRRLAPRTFTGDEKAKVELDGIEDRTDELSRTLRVADAAIPGLEDMVKEAEDELKKAQIEVYKAEASQVYYRLKEAESLLDEKGEAVKAQLAEVDKLASEYHRAVVRYMPSEEHRQTPSPSRSWVKDVFARWLR